jgi:hypothetical protein
MEEIIFPVVRRGRVTLDGIDFDTELRVARQTSLVMARPAGSGDNAWTTWHTWDTDATDPIGDSRRRAAALGVTEWDWPRRYVVHVQVEHTDGTWTGSRSLPSFHLDTNILGIVDEAHAARIARDVVSGHGLFDHVTFHLHVGAAHD